MIEGILGQLVRRKGPGRRRIVVFSGRPGREEEGEGAAGRGMVRRRDDAEPDSRDLEEGLVAVILAYMRLRTYVRTRVTMDRRTCHFRHWGLKLGRPFKASSGWMKT